jgi:hypothetical protein
VPVPVVVSTPRPAGMPWASAWPVAGSVPSAISISIDGQIEIVPPL